MNQAQLFIWFKNRYLAGRHEFLTCVELCEELRLEAKEEVNPRLIGQHVNRLYAWGFLEIEQPRFFNRKFRVNPRCLNMAGVKHPLSKDLSLEDMKNISTR